MYVYMLGVLNPTSWFGCQSSKFFKLFELEYVLLIDWLPNLIKWTKSVPLNTRNGNENKWIHAFPEKN